MPHDSRFRLDDLRRVGAALGAAAGLAPARAAALTTQLLWYDAAGLGVAGFAQLPNFIERVGLGEIDPKAEGRVSTEHPGTALLDGGRGVAPLILARAASIAGEKAREVGVGMVRVTNLGPTGPAAAVVAEMAVGPEVGLILGPGPSWAAALPSAEGLPLVYDSRLAGEASAAPPLPLGLLVPEGDWLVAAIAARATEHLAALHERVSAAARRGDEAPGLLRPTDLEQRRRAAREQGVGLAPSSLDALRALAARFGVGWPNPT